MKGKRKLLVAMLVMVLLAAVLGWRGCRHRERVKGDLVLYGNVDIRKVDLGFRVGGRLAEIRVEEGDRATSGRLLARLDDGPYRDDLNLARARHDQAVAILAKLEAGSRPQEIAQARALVAERLATVGTLELEFRRSRNLVEDGAISRQAFDDVTARLAEARARLATARQALKLAVEGFRTEDIAAARAEVRAAAARLAQAETRLTDTELLAPDTGVVLTRVLEPGAIVPAGAAVLSLTLDDPVWVRVYVDEPDLGRVYPGMPAQVFTDSAPRQPYRGQVGFISPEAEFTPKTVQTEELRTRLVYQLRVVVANPDRGLRQGMPVTVRLQQPKVQTSAEERDHE